MCVVGGTWVGRGGLQDSNCLSIQTDMTVFQYLNHQNACMGAYLLNVRPESTARE